MKQVTLLPSAVSSEGLALSAGRCAVSVLSERDDDFRGRPNAVEFLFIPPNGF
jgi:hypothetical protein